MSKPFRNLPGRLVMLALLAAVPGSSARAEEQSPATRLFTASDFGHLSRGITVPQSGRYTVRVWTPGRQLWSLTANGQAVVLSARTEGADSSPRWQTVGEAALQADAPVKITVASPERSATSSIAKEKSKSDATKAAPLAVPAVLVMSTDPKFDTASTLDLIRGRIDSADPSPDPRRTQVRTNKEGTDFRGPGSPQAWRDRSRAVREQLLVTMGLWPMWPKTPMQPRVFGKLDRDGYTIEKVVLETFPGFTLSGNLYRPAGMSGKLPGMLCPHGHWPDGRVNPDVQQRCIRWAKLGCVVFMYDMVGYNDSKAFGHSFLNDRLRRWGLSLVTLQTWNSIRALDWLTTLPDVDPARIGCTGESGGGTQTFLLTAIDDRIKVAAPVVMVSDSFQGGCACENAAGLRLGTDNVEIAALTAPRPMKLVGATGDWTAKTMTNAYPTIRGVYERVGTVDRLSADVFDFPHNYNQTTRNAVYAFMARWLLGVEDAASTREGTQTTEKPEDLRTFTGDHPAPTGLKSAAELEAALIAVLGRQLDALAPGSTASSPWEAARAMLQTSLKVRVGAVDYVPSDLEEDEVRRASREGMTIVHSLLGRAVNDDGERIPVARLIPKETTGRLTVIATPRGKAGLSTPSGTPSPLVRELLKLGQTVVGFDPLLVGEAMDPAAPASHRPDTAHFEAYNPALAGDQMQDLAMVVAWARGLPGIREVSLVGQGMSGPQALLARPSLAGLARTVVDLHGFDFGDGSGDLPPSLDLPGVLQFGGLKVAAALTAPAPLWIHRAGAKFDEDWPEASYSLAGSAHTLRIDAEAAKPAEIARWIDSGEK